MFMQKIDYQDDDVTLEGYYAYDEKSDHKRPVVLVCHDWSGKNEFACNKANKLAELGYIGFAIDMFGKGKLGKTKEEKSALINPLVNNRKMLLNRIMAGFEAAKTLPVADTNKMGAIGFCFGGLCVLDLARGGANLKGVVSFHGLLNPPETTAKTIHAKVLALHGYDDPMVPPQAVMSFAKEMTNAHVDWQLDMYGHTMHAFTNPEANDAAFGTVYNQKADSRSWIAMTTFFKEVL